MIDPLDLISILTHLRNQVQVENVRITLHAQQEMLEEEISLDDVYTVIKVGRIIENYPEHRRGACCLLYGEINSGQAIHLVCTTTNTMLIVITAYRPKPPKWITPTQRKMS
jgi:hypothetical protein